MKSTSPLILSLKVCKQSDTSRIIRGDFRAWVFIHFLLLLMEIRNSLEYLISHNSIYSMIMLLKKNRLVVWLSIKFILRFFSMVFWLYEKKLKHNSKKMLDLTEFFSNNRRGRFWLGIFGSIGGWRRIVRGLGQRWRVRKRLVWLGTRGRRRGSRKRTLWRRPRSPNYNNKESQKQPQEQQVGFD